MKPGELERRLARLAKMAEEAKHRLDELDRDMREVRSAIDELAASCKVPGAGAGEAGNGTSDSEAAQVEAAFK